MSAIYQFQSEGQLFTIGNFVHLHGFSRKNIRRTGDIIDARRSHGFNSRQPKWTFYRTRFHSEADNGETLGSKEELPSRVRRFQEGAR